MKKTMLLHQTSGRWQLGFALSLVTVLMWAVLPLALSILLQELDVYTIIWFRFTFSFSALFLYQISHRQLSLLPKLAKIPWGLLAIATLGLAGNYFLFMQGLSRTSPSHSQVITELSSVFMGFGAMILFKERYTMRQWVGLSILTAGFVLFFNEQLRTLITSTSEYWLGNGLLIMGSMVWSSYALAQKQILQSLSSSTIMMLIYGGSSLLFSPFASPEKILTLDGFHLGILIFCAFNTLIAYGAFSEALNHLEASRVSAILSLLPIFTISFMWLFAQIFSGIVIPERLTMMAVFGAVIVAFGSMIIALGESKSPSTN